MRSRCGQQGTTYHTAPPRASKKNNPKQNTMNNLGTTYTDAEAAIIIRSLVAHNEHDDANILAATYFAERSNPLTIEGKLIRSILDTLRNIAQRHADCGSLSPDDADDRYYSMRTLRATAERLWPFEAREIFAAL